MASKVSKNRKIMAFTVTVLCIVAVIVVYGISSLLSPLDDEKTGNTDDFVRFIDVGQGDCALIYSNGYSALIDTGTSETANEVCATLDDLGIENIDVLVLSHLHDDHTGGVGQISEFFGIKNVILPEISIESEGLADAEIAINKVKTLDGGIYNAVEGLNFEIGDFEVTVLASFGEMKDENNRSIIVAAKIDDRKFLFTGDATEKAEKALLNEGLNLKCDVLKAGHHGSNTSSCEEFLRVVRPRFAAISVGKENSYGHPHNEVLSLFEKMDVEVYRTDYHGDIIFYVENGNIKVSTQK